MRRSLRRILVLAATLLAGACTVGPNYKPATPPVPAAFAGPQPTADAGGVDLVRWWQAYNDPELTRLIAIGLRQAPDLQTAASRLRQARLQIIEARAQGMPTVDGSARATDYTLLPLGSSDLGKLLGTTSPPPNNLALFSAGFDARWELDLFGGVRRQVEAARAQEEAAQWNLRDAQVSLAAEIAADYLQMRGLQAQARIQQFEADRQARAGSLLAHTAQVGLAPQSNEIRQNTQIDQARAQVSPLQAQAGMMMHALAALVGEQPETLIPELDTATPLPPIPPEIPPGLPIDLIRRRPDVRMAERQLAAATAQIGVAVADLYPKLSLSAMPGLSTGWIGSFFIGKSVLLSEQGQVSFPIFDFGRRRAVVGERREQREQAYVQWRKTVLGALRDVEDSLVTIEAARGAHRNLVSGVANAQRSLATVEAQFRVGLQDYTPVLQSQQALLQAQNALVQNDVALRSDIAAYYKALGGGWSPGDAMPLKPEIEDAPKKTRKL
jgi:NodT family efflux transporter outer membrane factor (OMF) lipoprotein